MSFLGRIFGGQTPTSVTAAEHLAGVEAELRDVPARIAKARAAIGRIADMNEEQHAAAEAELAAALRSEARLTAQIDQLRAVRARAEKDEAAEALLSRREAAQRRVDSETPKLIAQYKRQAEALARTAAEMAEISGETEAVNRIIFAARREDPASNPPPGVVTIVERFLTEPDTVDPDRVVEEAQWGYFTDGGRWVRAGVFTEVKGEMVPQRAGYTKRIVRDTIPGRVRKGRVMALPTEGLMLPAGQIGADAFWPKPR